MAWTKYQNVFHHFNLKFLLTTLSVIGDVGLASGPCALLEPRADALCIPLASINRAFRDARQYFGLTQPLLFPAHKTLHHLHEVDLLGMVLTQTTKYLAKEFQLTQHQIDNLLPSLDLELTDIWAFCPEQFRPKECKLHKYREINGACNNLNYPEWGSSHTPFKYLLPAVRPDGVDYPKDPDGTYLPHARTVSSTIHRDKLVHDHVVTVMLIAWGQLMDHDITLTAETKDPVTKKDPDCCKYLYNNENAQVKLHHNCFPIQIPPNDEFYSGHHQQCMNFARSFAGVRQNCRLGTRTAMNSITSFLDANFVYGSGKLSFELRTGKYGMLKSLPILEKHGLKDLLPLKLENPDEGCIRPSNNIFCFLAGDHRVNEQLVLTVVHTIFMREHNRIALELSKINPHWLDERIYQETRRIIIAITQHITFEEFLPMVLGKQLMKHFQISIEDGYWNGYDSEIDPSATEEFITAAFRFGHSLLPQRIERRSSSHHFIESHELSAQIRQPFEVFKPGHVDTYILGMINQLAQSMDEGVTEQVTNLLFRKSHQHFGMDLAAINIQRGRDHAIASYTAYRKMCGLTPVTYWEDLNGIMRNETVTKYRTIYRSPHDIDLWSGGVSEIPSPGSLIGPTFGCIIAKQFQALRSGDRHWYELPGLPSSFSEEQLAEIKKVKLSRVLCDNSDSIKTVQVYVMMFPDPYRNPRVPCQGLVLPRVELSKWKESVPQKQERDSPNSNLLHLQKDNYVTLHPPKFDPLYLEFNKPQNSESGLLHNISFETTKFSHETQGYPELSNTVDYKSNNGPLEESSERVPPEYVQTNNYRYFNGFSQENFQQPIKHDSSRYTEMEILENLEAPPIEPYQSTKDGFENYNHYYLDPEHPNPPQLEEAFIPKPETHADAHNNPFPPPPNRHVQFSTKVPRRRNVNPFPPSPFPGLGGIFSSNPGYLVKQKFSIPMAVFKG